MYGCPHGTQGHSFTVLTPEEEAAIVAFRRLTLLLLDDCLYALQASIPNLTRSSLHRCLQRHGISKLPDVAGDKARKKFKQYPIGYFHIDIAKVHTAQGKLYLFVAIDRTSKFAYAQLHAQSDRTVAIAFLRSLIETVPYKIHTILLITAPILLSATLPQRPNGQIHHSHVRFMLPRASYSTPHYPGQSFMEQRPSRTHEPHDQ